MRDFRDAKAMAHTLHAALAAKGHEVSNSESLELIAQAFGLADWNILSATIPRGGGWSPQQRPLAPVSYHRDNAPSTRLCPFSESTSTRRWSISCSP
jgi:hypothetical protein